MEAVLHAMVARIRDAADRGTPLRIRGGGSKDFYGGSPQGEIFDTSSLTGFVSYEPSELVVTARAGTPLAELEALLGRQGQCLPFEPPHFGGNATVGGMVAAGLSGPARASVGPVRDYVLGLTLINGRGELLTFGGQVMKNVAGYDLSRLMVGALGTLGLIVEVSLKVLPAALAEATLRFEMGQEEALRRLNGWGGQPLPLNASCWVEDEGHPTLLLRLRGAVAAVEAACRALGGEREDNARAAEHWRLCRDQQLPWFTASDDRDLWRLAVPQAAPALDLPEAPCIEWHGGQRWVRAVPGEAERLRELARRAGGHATLFRAAHGPLSDTGVARFTPLDATQSRIQRELKRQFDPAGIFNRARLAVDF